MKTKLIIIIMLLVQIRISFSQEYFICGTPDISIEDAQKLPWYGNDTFLPKFVDSLYSARNLDKNVENDVARIPVKFWVYRKSDGTPGGTDRLPTDVDYKNMMNELNSAFRNNNVPIRFYMMHSIGYVDNDDYTYTYLINIKELTKNNLEFDFDFAQDYGFEIYKTTGSKKFIKK